MFAQASSQTQGTDIQSATRATHEHLTYAAHDHQNQPGQLECLHADDEADDGQCTADEERNEQESPERHTAQRTPA